MIDPSFGTELERLVELATQSHQDGLKIAGFAFADERGWLSERERDELRELEAWGAAVDEEIRKLLSGLRQRHEAAWQDHTVRARKVFVAIECGSARAAPRVGGTNPDIDRLLAPDLICAWSHLADGTEGKHSTDWALAVGTELLRKYGASVP